MLSQPRIIDLGIKKLNILTNIFLVKKKIKNNNIHIKTTKKYILELLYLFR